MQNSTEIEWQGARLRKILLAILEPIFVFVASILLLTGIPYFPYSVSILVSFALAALCFKNSASALIALFILAMPGFIYQGGFPGIMVGIIGATFFVIAITCLGAPGAALGVATGVIAAMLMFTPLYFLAIPFFVGVALFRTHRIKVGVAEGILAFIAIYVPFLAMDHALSLTEVAPLFTQIDYTSKDPASVVELSKVFNHMKDSLGSNEYIIDNMAIYWPTKLEGRGLGIVLLVCMAFATGTAFVALTTLGWFRQRMEITGYLVWWAPTFALLAANLAFLIPIITLKSAFEYDVDFGPGTIVGFLVATVAIGNAGAAIDHGLTQRERLIELRHKVQSLMPHGWELMEALRDHLIIVKRTCPDIDVFSEKATLQNFRQELSFISSNIETMDPTTLNEKLEILNQLEKETTSAYHRIRRKMSGHIDDSRHEYRSLVGRASDIGLSLEGDQYKLVPTDLEFPDDQAALGEQGKLNQRFAALADELVTFAMEMSRTIKEEIAPEFVAVSTEIAQNYLQSGNYSEAIQASLDSLSAVERLMENATAGLSTRLDTAITGLQEAIRISIVPAIESTNDASLVSSFNEEFVRLQKLRFPAQPSRKLSDLLQLVRAARELSDWTDLIVDKLYRKIRDLEKEIDSRVPSGYNWGKSELPVPKRKPVQSPDTERHGKASVEATMEATEAGLIAIEQAAAIIREYMTAREFAINYPNIEYLLEEKLREQSEVSVEEIPVKLDYAIRYLQLYAQKNYREVTYETRTRSLAYRED